MSDVHDKVMALLAGISDPEIPAISIVDLGIVRSAQQTADGAGVEVVVTPTYSGCPALDVIERAIGDILGQHYSTVRVTTVLDPPWTTDRISERGLQKLRESGIAPPRPQRFAAAPATATMRTIGTLGSDAVPGPDACPHCGATDVERLAEFGSTACKALWRCRGCREPFDYFKPLRETKR